MTRRFADAPLKRAQFWTRGTDTKLKEPRAPMRRNKRFKSSTPLRGDAELQHLKHHFQMWVLSRGLETQHHHCFLFQEYLKVLKERFSLFIDFIDEGEYSHFDFLFYSFVGFIDFFYPKKQTKTMDWLSVTWHFTAKKKKNLTTCFTSNIMKVLVVYTFYREITSHNHICVYLYIYRFIYLYSNHVTMKNLYLML